MEKGREAGKGSLRWKLGEGALKEVVLTTEGRGALERGTRKWEGRG